MKLQTVGLMATVCVFSIAIGMVFGIRFQMVRIETNRLLSDGKISQLRAALINYHDRNGRFPPTVYREHTDDPSCSWRVLLLPYLEDRNAYSKYNFSKPWNSIENSEALRDIRHNPFFSLKEEGDQTTFLAIDDQHNWPSKFPLRAIIITKGGDTFTIAEFPDSKIPWMKPEY